MMNTKRIEAFQRAFKALDESPMSDEELVEFMIDEMSVWWEHEVDEHEIERKDNVK